MVDLEVAFVVDLEVAFVVDLEVALVVDLEDPVEDKVVDIVAADMVVDIVVVDMVVVDKAVVEDKVVVEDMVVVEDIVVVEDMVVVEDKVVDIVAHMVVDTLDSLVIGMDLVQCLVDSFVACKDYYSAVVVDKAAADNIVVVD